MSEETVSQEVEYVTIKNLASELSMDRSHALKLVKAMNLVITQVRNPESGMQAMSAISRRDADMVIETRKANGFSLTANQVIANQSNFLYVVAVDPEMRPGRVKVGKSMSVDNRIDSYRTICPQLEVIRTWSAPESCEGYLIALADAIGTRRGIELFDMNDMLGDFLSIADQAFSVIDAKN